VRAGIEQAPRAEGARPLQRALALDVDREHAADAATGELGGLVAGVTK
jgi:hypothetical protein